MCDSTSDVALYLFYFFLSLRWSSKVRSYFVVGQIMLWEYIGMLLMTMPLPSKTQKSKYMQYKCCVNHDVSSCSFLALNNQLKPSWSEKWTGESDKNYIKYVFGKNVLNTDGFDKFYLLSVDFEFNVFYAEETTLILVWYKRETSEGVSFYFSCLYRKIMVIIFLFLTFCELLFLCLSPCFTDINDSAGPSEETAQRQRERTTCSQRKKNDWRALFTFSLASKNKNKTATMLRFSSCSENQVMILTYGILKINLNFSFNCKPDIEDASGCFRYSVHKISLHLIKSHYYYKLWTYNTLRNPTVSFHGPTFPPLHFCLCRFAMGDTAILAELWSEYYTRRQSGDVCSRQQAESE